MSNDSSDLPREVAVPRLVETHGGRLRSLALRFCGNPEEADDLVQEVFLQAWRKWDQFEGRSAPLTWLYTIAARACQRRQRRRSGEPEQTLSLDETLAFGGARIGVVPSAGDGPLDAVVRREGRQRIETAIAALPEAFRMPVVLKEIVGLSVAEVADVLGIPAATVKTRLHRARLRLRQALESVLPQQEVAPAVYSRQVCLDLLEAKQAAMDRGIEYVFPDGVVCERCSTVFAGMDLARDLCRDIGGGGLPPELRALLEREMCDAA